MISASYKSFFYIFILFVGMVSQPPAVNAADGVAGKGNISRGAKSWANNCSRCHNMREPSEFRDDLWQPIVTHMRVRAGLTGRQARDILAYLQSSNFTPVRYSDADGKSSGLGGEQIYNQTCIACHGPDGKGAVPGVPDLRKRLSKSDQTLLQHIENGFQSPGSTLAMPPRGGNPDLSRVDLETVLEYLRSEFK